METNTDNLQYKDFREVCRICLRKQTDLIDIFEAALEDFKNIVYVFRRIFAEDVVKDDGKPEQICTDCINSFNEIHRFLTLYDKSKKVCERILEQKRDEEAKQCRSLMCSDVCCFCGFDFRLDPCKKTLRRSMRLMKTHILEEHLIEIRNAGNLFCCLKCKVQFKERILIENHFLSDEHQNRTCRSCKSEFNTVKNHFEHLKSCKDFSKSRKFVENEIYKCIHCENTEIKGFEQMLAHFHQKHKQNCLCLVCEKRVNLHMELHLHSHRPLRMKNLCLRCLDYFETPTQLAEHKKTVDHSKKQCDICGLIVRSRKFAQHRASHENAKYICELCGVSFVERNSYTRHYKVKHLGHRYYCDQCSQSYSTYKDLTRHMTRLHSGLKIDKPKKSNLKRILKKNPNIDILQHRVVCLSPDCELTFPNQGILLEHMNSAHEKFTCQTCNKEYFNPTLFESHCMMHVWQATPSALYSTSCRICNENQTDLPTLSEHVKQHKLYLCPKTDCGEIFASFQTLQKHKIEFHKKAETLKSQFICSICNKKFLTARKFSVHQERHNESRKFKCDVCSLMFSTGGQLRVHSRIHTGERPYVCRFCTKSFASSYTKKLHERIHTGEKPYSCPHCQQRFSDGSHRRQHILQHQKKNNELLLLQQSPILN